jgi:thioesterase domain-containing protein
LCADDDFFNAGGDSLLAIRIIARGERELGLVIPVRTLVEGRSVRRVLSILANNGRLALPQGIVLVREGDRGTPLFCLPGVGASVMPFVGLAAKLSTRGTVYGVDLQDLDLADAVLGSLVETAVAVVRKIREVQHEGPYRLLGYSYGGNLAVEVARVLSRDGEQVEHVVVLDGYAPGAIRKLTGIKKLPRLLQILRRMQFREAFDYLASRTLYQSGRKDPEPLSAPPHLQSDLGRRYTRLIELGTRAVQWYRPHPFDQRIVLVKATILELRGWREVTDASDTNGWGSICRGGVELVRVDCKHAELLSEPNLSKIARRLDEMFAPVVSS